jgi:hypothetical protein
MAAALALDTKPIALLNQDVALRLVPTADKVINHQRANSTHFLLHPNQVLSVVPQCLLCVNHRLKVHWICHCSFWLKSIDHSNICNSFLTHSLSFLTFPFRHEIRSSDVIVV